MSSGPHLGGLARLTGERARQLVLQLRLEQLEIAEDHGQQVVEVMRHAAGELAHRLHALGLQQDRLLLAFGGRVVDEHEATQRAAAAADNGALDDRGGKQLARLAAEPSGMGLGSGLRRCGAGVEEAHAALGILEQARHALAQHLGLGIAEHARERRVDQPDRRGRVADHERVGQAFEDRAEQGLLALEALLGGALRAQVDNGAGEVARAPDRKLADREVHGEGGAVLAQAGHFAADADDLAPAGGEIFGEVGVVLAAVGLRHQHVDVAADQLVSGISEHFLGRGIDGLDVAAGIDGDDGRDRRLEDRPELQCLQVGRPVRHVRVPRIHVCTNMYIVRYLGVEVDDALEIAETIDV